MIHPREFALLQEVLQISARKSAQPDGGTLTAVRLQVGVAALVLPDQLLPCWKALVEGTEFSHVRLEIEPVPLTLRCLFCRKDFKPREKDWSCRWCGSPQTEIIDGRQVVIKEIDVVSGSGVS